MPAFVERELKLEPGDDFTLPELPGEPLESRVFTSTYYDTPSRSLSRVGITLRRRVENGLSRWQLKLPRGGTARTELEAPGGPAGPPPRLASLLASHLRSEDLEPVATLRTRRAGVRVAEDGRAVADVTVDSVDVLDAGRSAGGFAEIEIELVDGDDDDLERLGRTLRRAGAKSSDGTPKLMRVLPPPETEPARAGSTTGQQLRALLTEQLQELLRHDPGVRLGDDLEDVHRCRVATRRARALIRATRPLLGETLAPLSAELKWLAGLLGPVRDLDVLLERLRAQVRTLGGDEPAGGILVSFFEEERERRRDELLLALDSDRYLELLARFEAAIAALPELDSKQGPHEIAERALKKLRKAAKKLSASPADEELHAVRIKAKRARYAAELAAVSHSDKSVKRYIDSLKEVQDVIGEHQDAVVAEERLRKAARAKTAVAAGRLVERERLRRSEQRRLYPEALAAALERGRAAFS
jgi:CHAD domain-containing protein